MENEEVKYKEILIKRGGKFINQMNKLGLDPDKHQCKDCIFLQFEKRATSMEAKPVRAYYCSKRKNYAKNKHYVHRVSWAACALFKSHETNTIKNCFPVVNKLLTKCE
jgi:hypothetical protein